MERPGPLPESRNTHQILTERLVIDLAVSTDAEPIYALIGRSDRSAVCGTLLWDGPDELSDIERCRTERFAEWGFHWVIRDRIGGIAAAGRPLGAIGLSPMTVPGRGEVGYWLGRPNWGNGLMTEALSAVVRFGFGELRYAKIEANVFTHNAAGRRLAEKVGMTLEGITRRAYRKYGEWVDSCAYGILEEELP